MSKRTAALYIPMARLWTQPLLLPAAILSHAIRFSYSCSCSAPHEWAVLWQGLGFPWLCLVLMVAALWCNLYCCKRCLWLYQRELHRLGNPRPFPVTKSVRTDAARVHSPQPNTSYSPFSTPWQLSGCCSNSAARFVRREQSLAALSQRPPSAVPALNAMLLWIPWRSEPCIRRGRRVLNMQLALPHGHACASFSTAEDVCALGVA